MNTVIEFMLDCLWILSQGIIGFAIILLSIIGANSLKNTWNEIKRRAEEKSG